jgi:xylulose-5-phosphate/fructose-6-phosphate phosphoketolase
MSSSVIDRPAIQPEVPEQPLASEELRKMEAYWRACNYCSVAMLYLCSNPLLREPLKPEHIKNRLLGHWGSDPGQSFTWVHLNRLIKKYNLDLIFLSGPGHGAPATLSNSYLEGVYSEIYPEISEDLVGLQKFFKQFSFPGGIGSHCTPETPGSIHEGGELGYSLGHGFGAAFDNPNLIVTVVVGDGEAETGPLATSWHSNKFLNPVTDGAVLPVLHLNGYKIANPTLLARIPHEELEMLMRGYGWEPYFVEGEEHEEMHQKMARALEQCVLEIKAIQQAARNAPAGTPIERPRWPMVILRSPKGWTGPKYVDGHKVEGSWRAHQIPILEPKTKPGQLHQVEEWLLSYKPDELFDENGTLIPELKALPPTGDHRITANPHANGGKLLKPLLMPDFRDYAVKVEKAGQLEISSTDVLAHFLRDVMRNNMTNFRVFGPDETASNKLTAIYEASPKTWNAEFFPQDADGGFLSQSGRVMEMLSETTLEGWFEGYVLTGRHGFFSTYEAFVHIIDSMFNQHAKWLEKSKKEIRWRASIASINLLITSLVWRQDHNGFTHQDPGFLDVVTNKSPEVTRIYLPPDANCLLSVGDHCLRSKDYINVIVADKAPHLQYLTMHEAILHCTKGIGIWDFASNDQGGEPDVVMACAGDIPTAESLAAVAILRERCSDLKIRFINVVDLFRLMPEREHPHGMPDREFDSLFTLDKPVIFNFHAYPALIHKLTYRRANHSNIHVRGYKEKGNINTPLELAIMNQVDRFNLAIDVIDRVPKLRATASHTKQWLQDQIIEAIAYSHENGIDCEAIRNWKWPL